MKGQKLFRGQQQKLCNKCSVEFAEEFPKLGIDPTQLVNVRNTGIIDVSHRTPMGSHTGVQLKNGNIYDASFLLNVSQHNNGKIPETLLHHKNVDTFTVAEHAELMSYLANLSNKGGVM